jgi:hypothetical protein
MTEQPLSDGKGRHPAGTPLPFRAADGFPCRCAECRALDPPGLQALHSYEASMIALAALTDDDPDEATPPDKD